MKVFFSCLALLFSFQVLSSEIELAVITSDADEDTTVFYLGTKSDGSLDYLRYITTTNWGKISDDEQFTFEQIREEGAVLKRVRGRDVIILYLTKNFRQQTGGEIKLNYLYHALRGTRYNTSMKLIKGPQGFHLADMSNKPVKRLFVRGNFARLLGLVGVQAIDFLEK